MKFNYMLGDKHVVIDAYHYKPGCHRQGTEEEFDFVVLGSDCLPLQEVEMDDAEEARIKTYYKKLSGVANECT